MNGFEFARDDPGDAHLSSMPIIALSSLCRRRRSSRPAGRLPRLLAKFDRPGLIAA